MQVANTVGLVTGGAGGLGGAVARMLVDGGGQVAIIDVASSPGAAFAAELGENALFLPTDVTRTDEVEAAVAATIARFGRIDLCLNAAGISPAARIVGRDGTLFPLDLFKKTIDINLVGMFDVTRQVAGAMSKNEPGESDERGLIINVASIAAFEGQVGQASYTASKGAIVALTLQLARDLAKTGIRVMAIAPGIMDTPMLAGLDDKRKQGLVDLSLFPKRLGTPEDFAQLARSIMENTMLNGDIIRLDAATRLG
jgi:3-hydroxyacyl-CoA dehydrogenase / 3-hydroxy-2-methylbutyryl-CoA dehydrogenase